MYEVDAGDEKVGAPQDRVELYPEAARRRVPRLQSEKSYLAAPSLVGTVYKAGFRDERCCRSFVHRAAVTSLDPDAFEHETSLENAVTLMPKFTQGMRPCNVRRGTPLFTSFPLGVHEGRRGEVAENGKSNLSADSGVAPLASLFWPALFTTPKRKTEDNDMRQVKWGILGVAKIAVEKVIPAMQRGKYSSIDAIASRTPRKATAAAKKLRIPRAYGSYEELLADPEIDAIYNPLPNHLHVPWSIAALKAGKHVLCEKPVALTAPEAKKLLRASQRTQLLLQEAFMVKTFHQWLAAKELVRAGKIGQLRAIQGFFSYHNTDPKNVRNQVDIGGGGIYDIGCYPITTSRLIYGEEPKRVCALIERDPKMRVDRLASVILEFPQGHATFTCSTQLVSWQRMQIFGTKGRIELQIPFNAPNKRPCRLYLDDGSDLHGKGIETFLFDKADQYTVQGDAFSKAILDRKRKPPIPFEDAVKNMAVIDAVYRSGKSGKWERPRA